MDRKETILPYFSDYLNAGNQLLSFLNKCIFVEHPICPTSGWLREIMNKTERSLLSGSKYFSGKDR